MPPEPTGPTRRRQVLATTGGLLVAALAGCPAMETPVDGGGTTETGSPTGAESSTEQPPTSGPEPSPTGTGEQTPAEPATDAADATPTPALDLREANVVGVEVTPAGEASGEYRFSVTLYHDDDGEDGYADWWQVETPAGDPLGRRDLLHAHGTRPFTRSEAVAVPDDVPCVVVRGHDRTHGYGGQAMVVTVATGATRSVRQGPEPQSFGGVGCP